MKKIFLSIGALLVVLFLGGNYLLNDYYQKSMDGEKYYVKITTDGTRINGKDDSGNDYVDYSYDLNGFDKKGHQKELNFKANKDRPLRKDAFLKITWNEKKGVTQYEEISQSDLPIAAKDQLK